MKMTFTIIVSFWFPLLVNAQVFQIAKPSLPSDSLQKILPLLNDSDRVERLIELARSSILNSTENLTLSKK